MPVFSDKNVLPKITLKDKKKIRHIFDTRPFSPLFREPLSNSHKVIDLCRTSSRPLNYRREIDARVSKKKK